MKGNKLIQELDEENKSLKLSLKKKSEDLNQTVVEFQQMKEKYNELLKALSDQNSEISYQEINEEDNNKNNNLEIQQWNQTWSRIVSMVSSHISIPHFNIKENIDKKTYLIDIISKLCEYIDNSPSTSNYEKLYKKYKKSKKNLKILRHQCESLLNESKENQIHKEKIELEFNEKEQISINQKLEELGNLLKKQLYEEKKLIKESKNRKNELKFSISDLKKIPKNDKKNKKIQSVPLEKFKYPSKKELFSNDSDSNSFQKDKISPKIKDFRQNYGKHVNELVGVVNDLRYDYKRIKQVLNTLSDNDSNFSSISYIDDSLIQKK